MSWFKVYVDTEKLKIVCATDKAILFKLPTEQTFWFPKKLLDFSDPKQIVITISEDMEIKDVGSFMDLSAVLDAKWKPSPSYKHFACLGGDNDVEFSDEDPHGVFYDDWIGPDDFGCN